MISTVVSPSSRVKGPPPVEIMLTGPEEGIDVAAPWNEGNTYR